jgi:hypothetical protein
VGSASWRSSGDAAAADDVDPRVGGGIDERLRPFSIVAAALIALRLSTLYLAVGVVANLRNSSIEIALQLAKASVPLGREFLANRIEPRAGSRAGVLDASPRGLVFGQKPFQVRMHGRPGTSHCKTSDTHRRTET